MKLSISPELSLPVDAVTETFGILAVKRAGKSNAAVVLAEEMFTAGLPWVAVDPKGDWWGVRSSADGAGPGLPIVVFGGLHADVPLEAPAGQLVADLVVELNLTCVLDVSEMTKADQRRFLTAFVKRLYQRNRTPRHIFCEEADEYIPQVVRAGDAEQVGVFETLVKRGGFRGLGCTLITQRSASLNNDVLTQVQTLFALRTTGVPDRKRIREWVDYHAAGKEAVLELPTLADGEAWVFSPNWLRTVAKIRFRRRQTFDSGATPKVGAKAAAPVALADVDIEALRQRMTTSIEKAKADDPRILRSRISTLERQLVTERRDHETQLARIQKELLKKEAAVIEKPVYPDSVRDWLRDLATQADSVDEWMRGSAGSIAELAKLLRTAADADPKSPVPLSKSRAAAAPRGPRASLPRSTAPATPHASTPNGDSRLSGSQQRILDSLAWLESVGMSPATKPQLALLAEQRPTSSGYRNNLSSLRTAGLLDYPAGGTAALTAAGRAIAALPDVPPTSEALHQWLYGRLSGSQARILQELIAAYPSSLPKPELAERAGQQATSSGYRNNLSTLRTFGLIDYPTGGEAVALPVLFVEAGR